MNATLLPVTEPLKVCPAGDYLIGILISLFILSYLIYTLAKPEKF
jgi:hypothetical protein